ncbi:MAG TPA: CHASE domain-containing protein [Noviherbaspirillum sp.]|uniref:CHASE domain-containing protein n=1 Tax=Noviherbaspirillum sp. TaxID=1926288 RepID=UPI002B466408|nr:CHASE domain-containing protein [Noviherbaspirillum sp.]HJV87668.1 CHASE domain-containing protein [Noviherbaspirillum sp.]
MRQIEERKQEVLDLFRARELLTALFLIISLLITYNLWTTASQVAGQASHTTFDFRVRESNERIRQRLGIYEQVLRATAGLFKASRSVTQNDFRAFVDTLQITTNYPGIQGIGYAEVIPPAELKRHIESVRASGFPNYTVWPEGKRDIYTTIIFLEPFTGRNLRAFGYDMFSEPTRQAAMALARDTGETTVSGKVTLVQEAGEEVQAGFLMYLPLYRHDAVNDTLEGRRANLAGWIYAPFRMEDFMHSVNGEKAEDLDIEIYDDNDLSQQARLYDSVKWDKALDPQHRFRSISRIEAGNRTWTIVTTGLPAFEAKMLSDRPLIILQAGISISLLVTLLIWLFLDDRARALQAAEQAMQLALYDTLTGLPNRKLLDERIEQALVKAKRNKHHVALLFIDLDKFKPVNDNYGHAYGDLLLKEVAKRLRSCVRESDTASRLGGDEFVALLSDTEEPHAVETVASKILERLNEPFEIAGHTFNISASIGAALYPEHGTDAKSLMKSADLAMYDAKNSGRSNVKLSQHAAADH